MTEKCVLCGKDIIGFGNNPYPLAESGRCCDECNDRVTAVRIAGITGEDPRDLEMIFRHARLEAMKLMEEKKMTEQCIVK